MNIPGMSQSDIKDLTDFIEKNPDLVTLIDLMIFSMGYAEHTQDVNDEKKLLWEN